MRIEEIQHIAKSNKIKHTQLSKTKLIKFIQFREGSFDCFASAFDGICDQTGCCWRNDCFDAARQGELS